MAADPPTIRFVNTFECPHPSSGVSKRPLIVGTAKGFVADSTWPPNHSWEKTKGICMEKTEVSLYSSLKYWPFVIVTTPARTKVTTKNLISNMLLDQILAAPYISDYWNRFILLVVVSEIRTRRKKLPRFKFKFKFTVRVIIITWLLSLINGIFNNLVHTYLRWMLFTLLCNESVLINSFRS